KKHTLRYYICPKNMNESRFVCSFKGINAQKLEVQVLATCQNFFQNQQLYSKINNAIHQRLKKQRVIEAKSTLTQEQLIDKLAKGMIDAESFRKQTHLMNQKHKTISSISDNQLQTSLQKVIQKSFTLNMLHPYIDEIRIT
ncbi:recombinase family protein, partial [Staphylococcus aureus]|nr:recombinase family protein [Staphylococcus aureus]